MPINRTYMCPECAHRMDVVLDAADWDKPPPSCEACDERMNQEFRPPAIGGSVRSRAAKITEGIIANDYKVANFQSDRRQGGRPTVRYKDETAGSLQATWQGAGGQRSMLETAISLGKSNRGRDGLNILQNNLASGAQPDLIEASKRRSIKVW